MSKNKPYVGGYIHVKEQLSNRYNEYINLLQYYREFVIKKRRKSKKQIVEKRIDKSSNKVYVYCIGKYYEYPITVYPITHRKQLTEYKEI
jgi:hypothetical protein